MQLTVGTRRVFKQFVWLEVGSNKVAASRPSPPDRACRDHLPLPTGRFADASRWALQTKKRKYEGQDKIMAGNLVADFPLVLSKQARIY